MTLSRDADKLVAVLASVLGLAALRGLVGEHLQHQIEQYVEQNIQYTTYNIQHTWQRRKLKTDCNVTKDLIDITVREEARRVAAVPATAIQ